MKTGLKRVAAVIMCVFAGVVFGQGRGENSTNLSVAFSPKPPGSGVEWKAEAARIAEARIRLVSDTLQRLIHERDPEKKASLMFLLGEYRASEAARVLVGMISFEAPPQSGSLERKRLPMWGKYPAYEALVKIGVSSIPEVIKRLETETEATGKNLAASVVRAVYGKELGELVLERASAKQSDAKRKANLEGAREIVRIGREP